MSESRYFPGCCGITRRGLLLGAGAGLAAGVPLGWLASRAWRPAHTSPATIRTCSCRMGFAAPDHNPRDDRRFRSHLSAIVTRMVNKIITIPCLKDHRLAGVTLALKNMSHGMNNNVARSHG